MKSAICLLILILLTYAERSESHSYGAPDSVCGTMTPGHGGSTQSCSNKYSIQSDKQQYDPNGIVRITVNGSTANDTFRGILLIAKRQTDDSIVGTWSTVGSLTQTLACGGVASTGITHTSNVDKALVQADWTAPAIATNSVIVIKATVVTTRPVYYVNCFSVTLMARQSNVSTNVTTGTSTAPPNTTTTTALQTDSVGLNVSWTYASGSTAVRMRVTNMQSSQWCAFALSTDQSMGEDHVFMCQYLTTNTVQLVRLINPGGHSPPAAASSMGNPGGTVSVTSTRVQDGVAFCEFTLSGFSTSGRRRRALSALSQSTSYYPLVAAGNLDSSNNPMRHTSRQALNQMVQLDQTTSFSYNAGDSESPRTGLMKAHGIIMIFTWILFVSTGVLIARYFKTAWPARKVCGKPVWFAVHRATMVSVAVLTIIGFILILVYEKGTWVSRNNNPEFAHSIVGILVISFAVIQPIMAFFRCHPGTPYRFIFNYLHAAVGLSALVLSVVAIFLAMFFSQFDFAAKKQWGVILAWACWLPVIFIVFQMIEIYFKRQVSDRKKTDSYDLTQAAGNNVSQDHPPEEAPNSSRDRIKAVALGIHILVALGLSLTLASLVGMQGT